MRLSSASRPVTASSTRPSLIATDLDGTYLSSDGTVSAENAAAVLAAQRAGIPVLFATGRPVRWLEPILDLPGAHPHVIASNGAVLYDVAADEILDEQTVPPDVARAVVEAIRRSVPGAAFGFETGRGFACEPAWIAREVPGAASPVRAAVEELTRLSSAKILVQHLELSSGPLAARVAETVGNRVTVTYSTTADARGLVEVGAAGVSKASMLQRCCARLGIDRADVAAFGDMPNDVEMLSWVGHPHVVANAHPALLDLSATLVESNDDAGVGRTIMRWLDAAGSS